MKGCQAESFLWCWLFPAQDGKYCSASYNAAAVVYATFAPPEEDAFNKLGFGADGKLTDGQGSHRVVALNANYRDIRFSNLALQPRDEVLEARAKGQLLVELEPPSQRAAKRRAQLGMAVAVAKRRR